MRPRWRWRCNGGRLVARPFEERIQPRIAGDLATDVANGPAEIGLEPAQRLVRPLELLGVGIALMADQRQLADPHSSGANGAPSSWPAAPAVRAPGG